MTSPPEIDLTEAVALGAKIWVAYHDRDHEVYRAGQMLHDLAKETHQLRKQIIILQQDARQADMDCDNAITQACCQELNDAADHVETFWGIKSIAAELRVRAAMVGHTQQ